MTLGTKLYHQHGKLGLPWLPWLYLPWLPWLYLHALAFYYLRCLTSSYSNFHSHFCLTSREISACRFLLLTIHVDIKQTCTFLEKSTEHEIHSSLLSGSELLFHIVHKDPKYSIHVLPHMFMSNEYQKLWRSSRSTFLINSF